MKTLLILTTLLSVAVTDIGAGFAQAAERYGNRPPVIVSPDLTAPWLMQLGAAPRTVLGRVDERRVLRQRAVGDQPRVVYRERSGIFAPRQQVIYQRPAVQRAAPLVRSAGMVAPQRPVRPIDPQFLPQTVAYETRERPGTIVIDTNSRFLYLVTGKGEARRYGVGVGKPGFEWAGAHKVTRKAEWPTWRPPSEMIAREAAKGHYLPASMEGGPANPLGARAMYLGSTLYRIHGTNAPWTIGYAVSSGCIRMRNEDVTDLYERVDVGTRVIVQ
ncbi:lipoprotein-anchoring transpeptidase ErfK/SrfK [Rhizobium sp. PP-F2F-G48]|uniref:L,D-transpeptidase n=1 Tax=Rhizobium sp. PP-F2F-G48 TaxID=2135651 RepID=UPI0010483163|nr:L,D-transpeptidase [Rhizobium sp. PP-F2F-G48]TCM55902.1 lipoprotein-anchoring transpeptidase ErfK/SrfK [Rhizobium sp. PP-F2F-G48]